MKTNTGEVNRPALVIYYWLLGRKAERRVIMGPYVSYEAADVDGYSNFGSEYEVIPLKTRDRAAAREEIRKKVLDETHDVEETFKRFRHIGGKGQNG